MPWEVVSETADGHRYTNTFDTKAAALAEMTYYGVELREVTAE